MNTQPNFNENLDFHNIVETLPESQLKIIIPLTYGNSISVETFLIAPPPQKQKAYSNEFTWESLNILYNIFILENSQFLHQENLDQKTREIIKQKIHFLIEQYYKQLHKQNNNISREIFEALEYSKLDSFAKLFGFETKIDAMCNETNSSTLMIQENKEYVPYNTSTNILSILKNNFAQNICSPEAITVQTISNVSIANNSDQAVNHENCENFTTEIVSISILLDNHGGTIDLELQNDAITSAKIEYKLSSAQFQNRKLTQEELELLEVMLKQTPLKVIEESKLTSSHNLTQDLTFHFLRNKISKEFTRETYENCCKAAEKWKNYLKKNLPLLQSFGVNETKVYSELQKVFQHFPKTYDAFLNRLIVAVSAWEEAKIKAKIEEDKTFNESEEFQFFLVCCFFPHFHANPRNINKGTSLIENAREKSEMQRDILWNTLKNNTLGVLYNIEKNHSPQLAFTLIEAQQHILGKTFTVKDVLNNNEKTYECVFQTHIYKNHQYIRSIYEDIDRKLENIFKLKNSLPDILAYQVEMLFPLPQEQFEQCTQQLNFKPTPSAYEAIANELGKNINKLGQALLHFCSKQKINSEELRKHLKSLGFSFPEEIRINIQTTYLAQSFSAVEPGVKGSNIAGNLSQKQIEFQAKSDWKALANFANFINSHEILKNIVSEDRKPIAIFIRELGIIMKMASSKSEIQNQAFGNLLKEKAGSQMHITTESSVYNFQINQHEIGNITTRIFFKAFIPSLILSLEKENPDWSVSAQNEMTMKNKSFQNQIPFSIPNNTSFYNHNVVKNTIQSREPGKISFDESENKWVYYTSSY